MTTSADARLTKAQFAALELLSVCDGGTSSAAIGIACFKESPSERAARGAAVATSLRSRGLVRGPIPLGWQITAKGSAALAAERKKK